MNFNHVFAPTSAAERFTKAHAANLSTYGLIVAIIALTGISAAIAFVSTHTERIPEYRIRLQLAKVRIKRWFVRRAIAFASFASYHGLDNRVLKIRELWRNKGAIARTALDAAFCLN